MLSAFYLGSKVQAHCKNGDGGGWGDPATLDNVRPSLDVNFMVPGLFLDRGRPG